MHDRRRHLPRRRRRPAPRVQALRHPGRPRHRACCGASAFRVAIVTGRVSESVRASRARSSASTTSRRIPTATSSPAFMSILERHGDRARASARSSATTFRTCRCCASSGLPVAVGNAVPEVRAICTHPARQRTAGAAPFASSSRISSRRAASGTAPGTATSTHARSRAARRRAMNADEIVERGTRVVRLEREALVGARGAPRRRVRARRSAHRRLAGPGDRRRRREVRADRPEDRRDADVDRHAGDASCTRSTASTATSGIVGRDDVAILISKSGESDELLGLLAHLKGFGVRTIAITGDAGVGARPELRRVARRRRCAKRRVRTISRRRRARRPRSCSATRWRWRCLQEKGFQREDFARIHPGGALGRQLVVRVEEIMLREDLPVLARRRHHARGDRDDRASGAASPSSSTTSAASKGCSPRAI